MFKGCSYRTLFSRFSSFFFPQEKQKKQGTFPIFGNLADGKIVGNASSHSNIYFNIKLKNVSCEYDRLEKKNESMENTKNRAQRPPWKFGKNPSIRTALNSHYLSVQKWYGLLFVVGLWCYNNKKWYGLLFVVGLWCYNNNSNNNDTTTTTTTSFLRQGGSLVSTDDGK